MPQGTNTPGVTELPRGGKTPGVTTVGESVLREDRRGRGGDEKPPTNRSTRAHGDGGGGNESMGGPRTVPLPRPQRGMTEDEGSAGTPTRRTAGTNSARPEHGALARREYGLLALTGTAVNPANGGDPERAAGHGATGE